MRVRDTMWRHAPVLKGPMDLVLYWQAISTRRPDVIVETGTKWGGSALFFADLLSVVHPEGRVITIDTKALSVPVHPRITYLEGSSVQPSIVATVRRSVEGRSVMVTLDSDHRYRHVKRELEIYAPLVTRGQYLVVEDCGVRGREFWPMAAVRPFVATTTEFVLDSHDEHDCPSTWHGWLRRL